MRWRSGLMGSVVMETVLIEVANTSISGLLSASVSGDLLSPTGYAA
jgi:hypothetical protein